MRISPKAQASIEYMTIIVLVVTGIVLMGPYVIRSINAHFQALDDQVQDSFQENITQAPNTNFNVPNCACDWQDMDCAGLSADGTAFCATNVGKRYFKIIEQ